LARVMPQLSLLKQVTERLVHVRVQRNRESPSRSQPPALLAGGSCRRSGRAWLGTDPSDHRQVAPSVACESSPRTQRHDGIIACGRNQFARNHVLKTPVLVNMNTWPTQILSPNQGVAESSRATRKSYFFRRSWPSLSRPLPSCSTSI
jgi:hypothetical protein